MITEDWIAVGLQVAYAALLLYYLQGWRRAMRQFKFTGVPADTPFVSVLLPVRNEMMNIDAMVQSLQRQNYPPEKTEWIFINDHSEDQTMELLMKIKDARLRIIDLPDNKTFGKKAALSAGVMAAKGEWILTTDADCDLPAGWISSFMTSAVDPDVKMICGLVKVKLQSGFLTAFQAMETAVLQSCGAGSLAQGYPLLNTGASLGFRKSTWLQTNGYRSKDYVASGDDTFLMLSFHDAFPGGVRPLVHPEAIAQTLPQSGILRIIRQRLRWNGKLKHYPAGSIHLVGLLVMAAAAAFIFIIFRFFMKEVSCASLGVVLGIRLFPEILLLFHWKKVAKQHFSLLLTIVMSVVYPLFTILTFIIRPFVNNAWKGRPL